LNAHRRVRSALLIVLLLCAVGLAQQQAPPRITDLKPTIILISIDGYRYDYLDKYPTPNLQQLAASGVRAESMQPSVPTYTFPNHYTLVTGLYPAHHGIVGNEFYDPSFNATFSYKDASATEGRWWSGEPIWVTAHRQGQKTASMFWPGSSATVAGLRPDHWETFDAKVTPDQRVDKILGWLDLPARERPAFLALYFEQVDHAGHEYGPDSPQVRDAVAQVDAAIGRLVDGMRQRGIERQVNIIVVSDHGMANTPHVIFIDDYIDPRTVRIVNRGPFFTLWPRQDENDAIFAKLQKVPHARAYRRENVPARWHFSGNPRIAPIFLLADEGWVITDREYAATHKLNAGGHGYDNNLTSMQATFIAYGQAFKPGSKLPAFPNIDVYDLMAYLLHLKPAKNDGTLKVFEPVLVKATDPHRSPPINKNP